ncbi:MAG: YihA family ribosome biogenesis GTP-binding protein [Betaproteobacteria bacterium]|nr:YihA family ribosome biogenesis GTP-binding protein [Betaproteobacteria bacterium]
MSLLLSAEFAATAASLEQLPNDTLAELAFVGRSNAGKSSAINAICRRKRLAFASRTPGRTQALNLFALREGSSANAQTLARLVDTPGYGYAQAPLALKRQWDGLAGRYLRQRTSLCAVVLVSDIRRGLTALDHALLAWIPAQVPRMILLTKADKLAYQERLRAQALVRAQLLPAESGEEGTCAMPLFSATKHWGVDEARTWIESRLTARPVS